MDVETNSAMARWLPVETTFKPPRAARALGRSRLTSDGNGWFFARALAGNDNNHRLNDPIDRQAFINKIHVDDYFDRRRVPKLGSDDWASACVWTGLTLANELLARLPPNCEAALTLSFSDVPSSTFRFYERVDGKRWSEMGESADGVALVRLGDTA